MSLEFVDESAGITAFRKMVNGQSWEYEDFSDALQYLTSLVAYHEETATGKSPEVTVADLQDISQVRIFKYVLHTNKGEEWDGAFLLNNEAHAEFMALALTWLEILKLVHIKSMTIREELTDQEKQYAKEDIDEIEDFVEGMTPVYKQ